MWRMNGCECTINESHREFVALAIAHPCRVAHPIGEVYMSKGCWKLVLSSAIDIISFHYRYHSCR
jgi:hypothetical protein